MTADLRAAVYAQFAEYDPFVTELELKSLLLRLSANAPEPLSSRQVQQVLRFTTCSSSDGLVDVQKLLQWVFLKHSSGAQVAKSAEDRRLAVHVATAAGLCLVHEFDSEINVGAVKAWLRDELNCPPSCQQLLLDRRVLGDTEKLGGRDDASPLSLTLVFSLVEVRNILSSGFGNPDACSEILSALSDLQTLGPRGGAESVKLVDALVKRESDPEYGNCSIVYEAVKVLPDIAEKGDQQALNAASGQLGHHDLSVRQAALTAIAHIACKGDQPSIQAFINRYGDGHAYWKEFHKALDELCYYELAQFAGAQRRKAEERWTWIARKGDRCAINVIVAQLERSVLRSYPERRRAHLKALATVAERGDQHAMNAALSRLENDDEEVRNAGVFALGAVAGNGDEHAIRTLSSLIEDVDVRQAAVLALAQITERGNKDVIARVSPCLVHTCRSYAGSCCKYCFPNLREAALKTLITVARKGDQYATRDASACLDHSSALVRGSALVALAFIVETGDPNAIEAVSTCFTDVDEYVRFVALGAMAQIDLELDAAAVRQPTVRVTCTSLEEMDERIADAEDRAGVDGGFVCITDKLVDENGVRHEDYNQEEFDWEQVTFPVVVEKEYSNFAEVAQLQAHRCSSRYPTSDGQCRVTNALFNFHVNLIDLAADRLTDDEVLRRSMGEDSKTLMTFNRDSLRPHTAVVEFALSSYYMKLRLHDLFEEVLHQTPDGT